MRRQSWTAGVKLLSALKYGCRFNQSCESAHNFILHPQANLKIGGNGESRMTPQFIEKPYLYVNNSTEILSYGWTFSFYLSYLQKDKHSELSYRWRHCNISQQPLQKPVVACGLGRLYSKMSVIEGLLDRSNLPATAQHIKGLKDVKELHLTPNPAFKDGAEKGDGYVDRHSAPYICPVIGLEMNGKFKFSFIWGCGCVMSERAFKEIKTKLCHKCQKPYLEEDIVILNAVDEDLDLMTTRMETRQARLKREKKLKKTAIKQEPVEENSNETQTAETKMNLEQTAPVVVKSELEENPTKLISKIQKPGQAEKRHSNTKIVNPDFKKAKGSYSVAKDPEASAVFKSLFTSSDKAKGQTRAHWITYNPFYN